jgi:hypothetical protein
MNGESPTFIFIFLLLNVKSHGSLHTQRERVSTVTGLISDRPVKTLSEWLNVKRRVPFLLPHEMEKKGHFLLLAG